MVKKEGR